MANIIDKYKQSRIDFLNSINVDCHNFRVNISNNPKVIYIFTEDKTENDWCYYSNFIVPILNHQYDSIKIDNKVCEGKGKMKGIYNTISSRYRSILPRCFFFIDRDLSDLGVDENHFSGNNVYTTDEYSWENNIVNGQVVIKILKERFGFTSTILTDTIHENEYNELISQFSTLNEKVCAMLALLMAFIVVFKKYRPAYLESFPYSNDIQLEKIIKIDETGSLENETFAISDLRDNSKSIANSIELILRFYEEKKTEIEQYEAIIKQCKSKYIRGHYLFKFCYIFFKYVDKVIAKKNKTLNPKLKVSANIGTKEDNLLPYIIDGKLDYPESLKQFVNERILAYCKTVA